MTRFPLRYAHQNILVGHGDARAALFRVDTVSYPFLATADKREWLRRLARFAFAVEADFSVWRVCRAYPADRYADQAEALLDPRGQKPAAWRAFLHGHEAHLRRTRSFVPEVYLAVSLQPPGAQGLGRGMDRMRRRVEALFGVAGAAPIPAAEIEALIVAEEKAFRRAESCLPVRRARLLGAIVPDPGGSGQRDRLSRLLRGSRAVVGPTVPLDQLPASAVVAEIAARLQRTRVLTDDPVFGRLTTRTVARSPIPLGRAQRSPDSTNIEMVPPAD